MAPRRYRSTSNAANIYVDDAQNPYPQRTQSPASQLQAQRQQGLTPAIYENNLKVLRRREPSIVSIFDQFSHVCVYNYHANKWEKQGHEGSMFLFEKQTYPPYGFFILNRVGTDDYIRPIYPEDDVGIVGDYLAFRYYPTFTKVRLAMGLPYPVPPEHRARLDVVLLSQLTPEEVATSREESASTKKKEWKGTSVTIGLWMFATDAREPLKDVMMRLHSYIKEGKVYPEEFRYGPGRPPPPNPHLRTASRASMSSPAPPANEKAAQINDRVTNPANGSGSELDKLFAKLLPSASSTPALEAPPAPAQTASRKMSVQDLFSALGGPQLAQSTPPPAPPPSAPPSRGLALLDSIFASATPGQASTPGSSHTPQAPPMAHSYSLPSHPEDIQIVSPKPTSSTLPQILNQDVISSLLGLDSSSRASSTAPSSAGSRQSRSNRYEGDTEYSEGELASVSDYSITSTALDVDADPAILAVGSSSGIPLLAVPHSETTTTTASISVQGDVTPRQTARGIGPLSPPLQPQRSASRSCDQHHLAPSPGARPAANGHPNGVTQSDSSSTVTAANAPPPSQHRELVPFSADSELWPYPRAPLDDRSQDDAEIVELDFTDTRALSDPAMFSSRLKEKQGQKKQEKRKKTREERAAERERKREEIERGWDDPVKGEVTVGVRPPSTAPGTSETAKGKRKERAVNDGTKDTPAVNGHSATGEVTAGGMRVKAARDAVISATSARPKALGKELPKNEFVRELLALIHTDKAFVDDLYQEYLHRAN
ncbi:hypothetical protein DAEQUDRAFT_695405 [Daedalea quercina L-15889]|uniref:mRNA-decapping enzyme C-terminal domain-containing protein n=1 Tax=Daedalea quercina L-15889 TaxID=1314783 RepID=A0A165N5Q0_9APHY|nr:hypothetical protein DAEQUDRAFT_695405 [Daedalea quercina L-15889]